MVLTRRLMGINKSPRRIDRRAGGRSKKINLVGRFRRRYDNNIKRLKMNKV